MKTTLMGEGSSLVIERTARVGTALTSFMPKISEEGKEVEIWTERAGDWEGDSGGCSKRRGFILVVCVCVEYRGWRKGLRLLRGYAGLAVRGGRSVRGPCWWCEVNWIFGRWGKDSTSREKIHELRCPIRVHKSTVSYEAVVQLHNVHQIRPMDVPVYVERNLAAFSTIPL